MHKYQNFSGSSNLVTFEDESIIFARSPAIEDEPFPGTTYTIRHTTLASQQTHTNTSIYIHIETLSATLSFENERSKQPTEFCQENVTEVQYNTCCPVKFLF